MNKLKKNYPGVAVKDQGGKWYTGFSGSAFTEEREQSYYQQYPHCDREYTFRKGGENKRVEIIDHETRQLRLQFLKTEKGMSSAVAVFQDKEGFEYKFSFSSLELILGLLHQKRGELHKLYDLSETRDRNGTWIEGTFYQAKKGQNYFIDLVKQR